MKKYLIYPLIIILTSCIPHRFFESGTKNNSGLSKEVYRVPLYGTEGQKIWIVDGLAIRRNIYPEFLYGGNDERYPFMPENEIWIDHAISAIEFEYTLRHELHERYLMGHGYNYTEAHDSSLALELRMRKNDLKRSSIHENNLHSVSPTDCYNVKEISGLPDSIRLTNIYRIYLGQRNGIDIWIVDGANVRRDIFPDFGLSGNDLAYKFIPSKEIWIDGDISCEETEFSIAGELEERDQLSKGIDYDAAYIKSLKKVKIQRDNANSEAVNHPP